MFTAAQWVTTRATPVYVLVRAVGVVLTLELLYTALL